MIKKNKEAFVRQLAKNTDFTQENVRYLLNKFDETLDQMLSDATVDEPVEVTVSRGIHIERSYLRSRPMYNFHTQKVETSTPKFRNSARFTGLLANKEIETGE